jgi:hypothetical protein
MERIDSFMDVRPTVLNDKGITQDVKGVIKFRGVDFCIYPIQVSMR